MKPMSPEEWTLMEHAIDAVLKQARSSPHDDGGSVEALIAVVDSLDHRT
jgi:hypothetical protein